jgi:hypothetical protein
MANVTQRFSSRVENYIKYQPGYPREIAERFRHLMFLTPRIRIIRR